MRDYEKFAYITIGIPRDSSLLRKLEEESRETGTSIQKLIPVKLYGLYSATGMSHPVVAEVSTPHEEIESAEANALAFLDNED